MRCNGITKQFLTDRSGEAVSLQGGPTLPGVEIIRGEIRERVFPPHAHDFYSLGIVEQGCMRIQWRDRVSYADAGSIVIIAPGEVHANASSDSTGFRYRMIYFEPWWFFRARLKLDMQARPVFEQPLLRDERLYDWIKELHLSKCSGVPPADLESLLVQILARLLDHEIEPARRPPLDSILHPAVRTVVDLFKDRHGDNPSLDELGERCGLNAHYLVRLFSEQIGLPPHAYLVNLKVHEAKRLISAGHPLTEIAYRSGFADQSHMNRHFKRHFGFTPGHYAKNVLWRGGYMAGSQESHGLFNL